MPCTYETPYESAARASHEYRKMKKDLDKLTRMLCSIFEANPPQTLYLDVEGETSQEELLEWWAKHQEQDRKRAIREAAKAEEEAAKAEASVATALRNAEEAKARLEAATEALRRKRQ